MVCVFIEHGENKKIIFPAETKRCKNSEPVELVRSEQVDGLVDFVQRQQVRRCLQVLLLQTQLLDEGLHRLAPHSVPGWRSKHGTITCVFPSMKPKSKDLQISFFNLGR